MAKTYSKVKVEKFLTRLSARRAHLRNQLEREKLDSMKPYLEGELKALDDFIHEVKREFGFNSQEDQLQLELEGLKKAK